LKQLHLDLKELGFEGSYDRVAAFARKWKVDQTDRVNSASKRTEYLPRTSLPPIISRILLHLQPLPGAAGRGVKSEFSTRWALLADNCP
ncbi:hypothetical protein ACO0LF_21845, partial [Undibacterium sp. Di27W]